ncbi:MAG: LytTR family DNA-binding domain-containing protein [Paracoccaceae bacterium]
MSRFLSHWKADLSTPVPLVLWVVLTVIVALAGPFGTLEELRLPARLLVWGGIIGGSILVGTGCRALVHEVLGLRDFLRGAPVIALLVVAICTWPVHTLATVMTRPENSNVLSLGEMALFIAAVSVGVGAFREVLARDAGESIEAAAQVEPAASPLPRLIDRLPAETRAPLVSISGRNHYVDVVTLAGRASLLMRFADALVEAEGAEGAQIHRSHWVAWDAVESAGIEGARAWVMLRNGAQLPVSRNHREKLVERGLL